MEKALKLKATRGIANIESVNAKVVSSLSVDRLFLPLKLNEEDTRNKTKNVEDK